MLRALIVDDEAPARFELRSLLEETGRVGTITEASSARDAVTSLVKSREHVTDGIDVICLKVAAAPAVSSAPAAGSERIPVEKGGHKVLVPINQIRYVEAKDDYSCIYTADDRFLSTISLAKLEQRLTPHGFYRVHRGYIVNLEYVQDFVTVSGGVVQLGLRGVEDKKIPVSRRRVVAVKRMLGL